MKYFIFIVFLLAVSCKPTGTSKTIGSGFTFNKPGGAPIIAPTLATSIALSSPSSSPDVDSTPTLLLGGVVSGETIKVFSNSNCSTLVGSAVASSATVLVTTSALAPGTYTFYTATTNSAGTSSCSSISVSYQYLGVMPTTATSLVLSSPTSPNYSSTPTFTASGGVVNGDTVKLFTDSGCTTQVGSALSTGTSVSITISALSTIGTYSFYTKSTNSVGTSGCSGALATYNYLGPSPVIQVSWTANREKAVNQAGGGYRVYYSTTSGFSTATASYVDVPYVSGATSPVSTTFSNFLVGTYYFKVVAYSILNSYGTTGGTSSTPSSEFSVTLP